MLTDTQRVRVYSHAASAKQEEDVSGWRLAVYAANVGGTYKDLAEFIGGVSPDQIETKAHAWDMYRSLRREYGPIVGMLRRLPYIYYSHFSALYKIKAKYKLDNESVFDMLMEVFQGKGSVSTRMLRTQADNDMGNERALPYEAGKAHAALGRLLSRGDLAPRDRQLLAQAFSILEELSAQ